jgi:hypothetical protein
MSCLLQAGFSQVHHKMAEEDTYPQVIKHGVLENEPFII